MMQLRNFFNALGMQIEKYLAQGIFRFTCMSVNSACPMVYYEPEQPEEVYKLKKL